MLGRPERRDLAAAGIDSTLVAPRRSWDEASLDAMTSILPDIHAIEPARA